MRELVTIHTHTCTRTKHTQTQTSRLINRYLFGGREEKRDSFLRETKQHTTATIKKKGIRR